MKKIIYTTLLISACNVGMAQYSKVKINAEPVKGAEFTSRPVEAEFIGFRNPESDDLQWKPILTKVSDNESENSELLEKIKEEKNALKQTTTPQSERVEARTTVSTDPVVGTNFAGVSNGGVYTPLDNTIAISNNDSIVAFVNAQIGYFTSSGTQTYSRSIYTLIGDATLTNNLCDPKVIFDPTAKRFIFYCQVCDQVSSHDKIVLGFSKSSNPADGWYFYKFTGNPLGDGSWWDYPKLGISNDEVFVTGNLFANMSSTYNQSVVMQIQKTPCYSGGTPLTKVWSAATIPSGGLGAIIPFTFLPLSYGQLGSYGPGIYLVTTEGATAGQNTYRLYDITNNIASGAASMLSYNITVSPTYSTPGDAAQKGTSFTLNTGDSRAQDGFYLHGNVYFVFNTDVGGYSAVSYNRLKLSSLTNTSATFSNASGGIDRAYPAIVSASNDSLDKSVLVVYEESGSGIYPRMCAVGCDSNMTWSSSSGVVVHSGTAYDLYDGSTTSQRWGDYTGLAKKYGDTTAWMAGMYANSSNAWAQWIAQLYPHTVHISHTTNAGVGPVNQQDETIKVYPNPIVDNYHVKFTVPERQNITINITDMEGRTVVQLYHSIVEQGESVFSFNKANLAPGIYSLNIIGEKNNIINERIVITGK